MSCCKYACQYIRINKSSLYRKACYFLFRNISAPLTNSSFFYLQFAIQLQTASTISIFCKKTENLRHFKLFFSLGCSQQPDEANSDECGSWSTSSNSTNWEFCLLQYATCVQTHCSARAGRLWRPFQIFFQNIFVQFCQQL